MAEAAASNGEIKINVKFGKEAFDLSLAPTALVGLLKDVIRERTSVQVPMQKLTHKGQQLKDDTKTLAEAGLKDGAKLLLVGSTIGAVLQATTAPVETAPAAVATPVPQKSEAENRQSANVIKLGPPKDAIPGISGAQHPVRSGESINGLYNSRGDRIRLTVKGPENELWVSSTSNTQKIPFSQINDVRFEPITEHPGYCIANLHMGNHNLRLFFLPQQFQNGLKNYILGWTL